MKLWQAALMGGGLYFLGTTMAKAVPVRALEGPLRPPPPDPEAPPPGPAAREILAFIDGLTNNELELLRSALPEHWWSYIVTATQMPTDADVQFVFSPATIDYAILTPEAKDQLKDNIVTAVGIFQALELQDILKKVGVM